MPNDSAVIVAIVIIALMTRTLMMQGHPWLLLAPIPSPQPVDITIITILSNDTDVIIAIAAATTEGRPPLPLAHLPPIDIIIIIPYSDIHFIGVTLTTPAATTEGHPELPLAEPPVVVRSWSVTSRQPYKVTTRRITYSKFSYTSSSTCKLLNHKKNPAHSSGTLYNQQQTQPMRQTGNHKHISMWIFNLFIFVTEKSIYFQTDSLRQTREKIQTRVKKCQILCHYKHC